MNQKEYQKIVNKKAPKSNLIKDCFKAFWVGGSICLLGEIILSSLMMFDISKEDATVWTSIILVFLGALFTGLGLYSKLGAYAGAGSIVPITGFANGVASPAIEFKTEGWVLGLGAKMFVIAGPVIVYGLCTSFVVGIIYYLIKVIV